LYKNYSSAHLLNNNKLLVNTSNNKKKCKRTAFDLSNLYEKPILTFKDQYLSVILQIELHYGSISVFHTPYATIPLSRADIKCVYLQISAKSIRKSLEKHSRTALIEIDEGDDRT